MIEDLGLSERTELPRYEVCIVGSGPAGLTVANELKDSGLKICVLESGLREPTPLGDRLRSLRSEGIEIKDHSRERVLGGASTTWSGLSSTLDPVDFAPRPHLRYGGWPISRESLLPYYDLAADRYHFPHRRVFDGDDFGRLRSKGDLQPSWTRLDEKTFLAVRDSVDFGRALCHVFEEPGLDLYLDATVLRLLGDPQRMRIVACVARTRQGREVRVEADVFIVAAGGIDNARILLNSRDICADGLGNEHDQVGRYLMNHPKNPYGVLRLERPVVNLPYYFGCIYRGYAGYSALRLREDTQVELGLLNSCVRLEPIFPWSDNAGVQSLVFLIKRSRSLLARWKERQGQKVVPLRDYAETGDESGLENGRGSRSWLRPLGKILFHFPRVLQYAYYRMVAGTKPSVRTVRLRNHMEMEPHPDNRVTLSEERDVYGQRLPLVRHRCTDLDKRSLIVLHETLAAEVEAAGLARLESSLESEQPWPIVRDASHHMGTTRMGTDPRTSVVDANCRLHTVENVYMAGSSVFPTSGCANPTFTIVALSIRLARNLRERVFAVDPEG